MLATRSRTAGTMNTKKNGLKPWANEGPDAEREIADACDQAGERQNCGASNPPCEEDHQRHASDQHGDAAELPAGLHPEQQVIPDPGRGEFLPHAGPAKQRMRT